MCGGGVWSFTSLSTIIQLYRGSLKFVQFSTEFIASSAKFLLIFDSLPYGQGCQP